MLSIEINLEMLELNLSRTDTPRNVSFCDISYQGVTVRLYIHTCTHTSTHSCLYSCAKQHCTQGDDVQHAVCAHLSITTRLGLQRTNLRRAAAKYIPSWGIGMSVIFLHTGCQEQTPWLMYQGHLQSLKPLKYVVCYRFGFNFDS